MEMFISFFSGKVMLFYGISLIMKEKSNASALDPDAFVSRPAFAESHYLFLLNNIYLCNKNELRMQRDIRFEF